MRCLHGNSEAEQAAGGEQRLVVSVSLPEERWLPEKRSWIKSGWSHVTRRVRLDGLFGETS